MTNLLKGASSLMRWSRQVDVIISLIILCELAAQGLWRHTGATCAVLCGGKCTLSWLFKDEGRGDRWAWNWEVIKSVWKCFFFCKWKQRVSGGKKRGDARQIKALWRKWEWSQTQAKWSTFVWGNYCMAAQDASWVSIPNFSLHLSDSTQDRDRLISQVSWWGIGWFVALCSIRGIQSYIKLCPGGKK